MCVYMYINTNYIYVYIHKYIKTMYTFMYYTRMYIYIYSYIYVHIYINAYACVYHTHSYIDILPVSLQGFPSQEMTPPPTQSIKPKVKNSDFFHSHLNLINQ